MYSPMTETFLRLFSPVKSSKSKHQPREPEPAVYSVMDLRPPAPQLPPPRLHEAGIGVVPSPNWKVIERDYAGFLLKTPMPLDHSVFDIFKSAMEVDSSRTIPKSTISADNHCSAHAGPHVCPHCKRSYKWN